MLKREDNNPGHLTFPQASTHVNSLVLTTFWESLATVVSKSLEKTATQLTTVRDARMGKEPGGALPGCLARGQECLMSQMESTLSYEGTRGGGREQFSTVTVRKRLQLLLQRPQGLHTIPSLSNSGLQARGWSKDLACVRTGDLLSPSWFSSSTGTLNMHLFAFVNDGGNCSYSACEK